MNNFVWVKKKTMTYTSPNLMMGHLQDIEAFEPV